MKNIIVGIVLLASWGGVCFAQSSTSIGNGTATELTSKTVETTSIRVNTYPPVDGVQSEKNLAYLINGAVIADKNEVNDSLSDKPSPKK